MIDFFRCVGIFLSTTGHRQRRRRPCVREEDSLLCERVRANNHRQSTITYSVSSTVQSPIHTHTHNGGGGGGIRTPNLYTYRVRQYRRPNGGQPS